MRLCGRNTQGVRIMKLAEGSQVVAVCRAEPEEEIPAEDPEGTGDGAAEKTEPASDLDLNLPETGENGNPTEEDPNRIE